MLKRRPWHGFVPEEEQETYRLAGLGGAGGIGERPALLIIDMQYRSVGEEPQPIREAIRQYPTSCGEAGWKAVEYTAVLIEQFRRNGQPILYSYVAPKLAYDRDRFATKVPGVMMIPARGYEFVREIAPLATDICIPKKHASAFFGTPLATYLIGLGVDSLVLTGCTTSGCIRASAVDACSLNFKILIPEEAVFDRSPTSHAVNLFDLSSKYADVMPMQEVQELLNRIPT